MPRGPRVLIDGRSGSGKTELAESLIARLPGWQLLRLDDVYPGWDGLEAGSRALHDEVLASTHPSWRRWDWTRDVPAERHPLEQARPLLVEGCGSLSAANRALADLGVWVELDDARRRERALARDGDTYAPHWERWAGQERAFLARERPCDHADLRVDGADTASALPLVLARIAVLVETRPAQNIAKNERSIVAG